MFGHRSTMLYGRRRGESGAMLRRTGSGSLSPLVTRMRPPGAGDGRRRRRLPHGDAHLRAHRARRLLLRCAEVSGLLYAALAVTLFAVSLTAGCICARVLVQAVARRRVDGASSPMWPRSARARAALGLAPGGPGRRWRTAASSCEERASLPGTAPPTAGTAHFFTSGESACRASRRSTVPSFWRCPIRVGGGCPSPR
jgi:hypothetical protein